MRRSRPVCRRRTRRTATTGAVRVIAGREAVSCGTGRCPTRPAPTRLIVWWLAGSVSVAAVAARWRSGGRSPRVAGHAQAPAEPGAAVAVRRVARGVGAAEVAHHADHPDLRRPLGRAGGAAQAGPVARGRRRRGPSRCRGAGGSGWRPAATPRDRAEMAAPGTATSTSRGQAACEVGVDRVQPAEHRRARGRPRAGRAPRRGWSRRARRRRRRAPSGRRSAAPWPKPSALTTAISAPGVRGREQPRVGGDRREVDVEPGAEPLRGCGGWAGVASSGHAATAAVDRAVERRGGAGDQRPVPVAVATSATTRSGSSPGRPRPAPAPAARGAPARRRRCPCGREVAAAVALLRGRVDRRTEVELVAAGVDQGQVDRRARDVRGDLDR